MAESNEQPPLCPCGFWGSVQTSGLCSVCYKQQQQQNKDSISTSHCTPGAAPSVAAPTSCPTIEVGSSSCDAVETDLPTTVTDVQNTGPVNDSNSTVDDEASMTASDTPSQDAAADSDGSTVTSSAGSQDGSPMHPVQKHKNRCFVCKARLELAFVEIGRCKCGYTFCELHRLPEQHACTYDHKGTGRKEARDKMISPKKHVGTSLRRLDSDT